MAEDEGPPCVAREKTMFLVQLEPLDALAAAIGLSGRIKVSFAEKHFCCCRRSLIYKSHSVSVS